jgi:hypothetical protein
MHNQFALLLDSIRANPTVELARQLRTLYETEVVAKGKGGLTPGLARNILAELFTLAQIRASRLMPLYTAVSIEALSLFSYFLREGVCACPSSLMSLFRSVLPRRGGEPPNGVHSDASAAKQPH